MEDLRISTGNEALALTQTEINALQAILQSRPGRA